MTQYGASGLPGGLTVDTTTGAISGTLTTAGTFTVTVTASNNYGLASTTLTLKILGTPVIASALTVSTLLNQPFSYQLTASGNPTSYGIFTSLNPNLTYNSSTHTVSGKLTTPGFYTFDLTVGNSVGTTNGKLTVNCAADANLLTIHAFAGAEGTLPGGPLVLGQDGNFYGITNGGGVTGLGTIYRLTPAGTVTVLANFPGEGGFGYGIPLTAGSDGNFYGTSPNHYSTVNKATIFKVAPDGTFTTLHTFNEIDGTEASSALVEGSDGAYYGFLEYNTSAEYGGLIYRITANGVYQVITKIPATANREFNGSMLTLGPVGDFYVTAPSGGSSSYGSILHITSSGTVNAIHEFVVTDGAGPSGLILGGDGNFYGTTSGGNGPATGGTFFRLTPSGVMTVLHVFNGSNEGRTSSAIISGPNGFYGVTVNGAVGGNGALFQVTTGGLVTILHTFSAVDGSVPGSLCRGKDGHFYGFTFGQGGPSNNYYYNYLNGSIFRTVTEPPPAVEKPPFFAGEATLGNGAYYLAFPTGNNFGYYSYLPDQHYFYHFDMGYEYWIDAHDAANGLYLYNFESGGFFYTSPVFPFPYLYDFKLSTVLYYFPDPTQPGHYNTGGTRYFFNFSTGKVISK